MIVRTYGRRSRSGVTSPGALNGAVYEISDEEEDNDPFAFRDNDFPSTSSSSFYDNRKKVSRVVKEEKNQKNPPFSQETLEFQESSQEAFSYTFSSQDSTRFERSGGGSEEAPPSSSSLSPPPLQLLRPRRREIKKARRSAGESVGAAAFTASLMETQECGEMMECVDEVEFALDGLRQGVGVRVRRASLLALLNVCGSAQQRRLLKAQGMAKTIIDVILDLSLDDPSSNLAAATLFYILTNDVQDSCLLDSSPSIQFLLKLLKPTVAKTAAPKAPSISQKLLSLRKDMLVSQDMAKPNDSSSTAIVQKVLETLMSCKELKASSVDADDMSKPELNPDWVSLLTMEKACLSAISLEETTGTTRKIGGNFKEKLRQLGGLDAVFELVLNFHSTLEGLIKHVALSTRASDSTDGKLRCLPKLLKCLKIMENATFLSKENQSHLLRLQGNVADQGASVSFVKLMVSFIKILSELSLPRPSSASSSPEMPAIVSNGTNHYSELSSKTDQKVGTAILSTRFSQECSSAGRYSDSGASTIQSSQRSSSDSRSTLPKSQSTSGSWLGNSFIDIVSSSGSGSCSLPLRSLDNGTNGNGHGPKTVMASGEGTYENDNDDDMVIDLDDSQDPFAFDEDDFAQSKWDKPRRNKGRRKHKRHLLSDVVDMCLSTSMLSQENCSSQPMLCQDNCSSQPVLSQEEYPSQPMLSQDEEQNEGVHLSSDTSCTTAIDKENCSLVADCLLTTIKVLMNLTNDNAEGCQQIAAFGGLETLSSLIARHFPSFSLSSCGEKKEISLLTNSIAGQNQREARLDDYELDFLVTILGLLVNMVENDSNNRSRLAATKVSSTSSGRLNEVCTGVIPLLCAIFLANRGSGETAEEENESLDAEEVVLQGEKEAEKMIVEAYAALLLAFLSTESKIIRTSIANYLPDRSLKVLVPVLDRFVTFHLTLNMISAETHKTVSEVIESCRLP